LFLKIVKGDSGMPELTSKDSVSYSRHLLVEARHLLLKVRQKELKPYHISPQQSNILDFIYRGDRKATLSEIAKYTGRGINTVSQQLIRMEKDGLVKKEREVPKSTLLSFELTEKGSTIYKNISTMESINTIMLVLNEEERQRFISMLKKIIDKAKQVNGQYEV